MPAGLRIHLYCLCWNDARTLPYFFRHYDELVDEYFIYDNGSTDGSLDLLAAHGRVRVEHFDVRGDSFVEEERRLGDQIWQRSRGKADWVIVTDIDEHIYRPNLLEYLTRCQSDGITAIQSIGYEMVSDAFPTEPDKLIHLITRGCRSAGLNRLCIFNPNAIRATHYSPGRHKAWPEGDVVWPSSPEVLLLHYKQLGVRYLCERSAELARGMKSGDIENGWGRHYQWDEARITEHWSETKAQSVVVPGLGELSHVLPDDFRGDEKIVEQSGLLDGEWYLSYYPDLAQNLVDPLTHFCHYGWKEGRRPNFYFDPVWYESTYPHSAAGGRNPLVYYVQEGERQGDWPSEHFDVGWYRQQHTLGPNESPLRHYLLRRSTGMVSPLPEFDLDGYLERHPDLVALGKDPFEDFARRRRTPVQASRSQDFPTYREVAAALGLDPNVGAYPVMVPWRDLVQVVGLFLKRHPFDEAFYRETYPDVDAAIRSGDMPSAFTHFVEHGFFEGREFQRPQRLTDATPPQPEVAEGAYGSA